MRDLPPINLDGFEPRFGCGEYHWGPRIDLPWRDEAHTIPWQDHQYHIECLAWYYHDWMGTHLYAQVWDYAQQKDPDQRWQMVLFLHRPEREYDEDGSIIGGEWHWTIRKEYETPWSEGGPSYAEVGEDVDLWVKAPESLRFIVE